jgi:hypothetical protein
VSIGGPYALFFQKIEIGWHDEIETFPLQKKNTFQTFFSLD